MAPSVSNIFRIAFPKLPLVLVETSAILLMTVFSIWMAAFSVFGVVLTTNFLPKSLKASEPALSLENESHAGKKLSSQQLNTLLLEKESRGTNFGKFLEFRSSS
jgi:hypothetical protein